MIRLFYCSILFGALVNFVGCGNKTTALPPLKSNETNALVGCGTTLSGEIESRSYFQDSVVAFGQTCIFETQTRICTNGSFGNWSGSYSFPSCALNPPLACGGTPHNGVESRTYYQTSNVPFGQSCGEQIQVRTCNNGAFGPWTGNYTFASCSVAGAASCGATPSGGTESRTYYQTTTVPYGTTCTSELQTRMCNNGTLGPWSGTYSFASCNVNPPVSCGSTSHNGTTSRTYYQAGLGLAGSTCVSETQTSTCNNGSFGAWSGTYTFPSCVETGAYVGVPATNGLAYIMGTWTGPVPKGGGSGWQNNIGTFSIEIQNNNLITFSNTCILNSFVPPTNTLTKQFGVALTNSNLQTNGTGYNILGSDFNNRCEIYVPVKDYPYQIYDAGTHYVLMLNYGGGLATLTRSK